MLLLLSPSLSCSLVFCLSLPFTCSHTTLMLIFLLSHFLALSIFLTLSLLLSLHLMPFLQHCLTSSVFCYHSPLTLTSSQPFPCCQSLLLSLMLTFFLAHMLMLDFPLLLSLLLILIFLLSLSHLHSNIFSHFSAFVLLLADSLLRLLTFSCFLSSHVCFCSHTPSLHLLFSCYHLSFLTLSLLPLAHSLSCTLPHSLSLTSTLLLVLTFSLSSFLTGSFFPSITLALAFCLHFLFHPLMLSLTHILVQVFACAFSYLHLVASPCSHLCYKWR